MIRPDEITFETREGANGGRIVIGRIEVSLQVQVDDPAALRGERGQDLIEGMRRQLWEEVYDTRAYRAKVMACCDEARAVAKRPENRIAIRAAFNPLFDLYDLPPDLVPGADNPNLPAGYAEALDHNINAEINRRYPVEMRAEQPAPLVAHEAGPIRGYRADMIMVDDGAWAGVLPHANPADALVQMMPPAERVAAGQAMHEWREVMEMLAVAAVLPDPVVPPPAP